MWKELFLLSFVTSVILYAVFSPSGITGERPGDDDVWTRERLRMVEHQIAARGVGDERVLDAMRTVPRHLFVPESRRESAYQDYPLPIGEGQTISQPYIVAFMTETLALQPDDRILEIGTGSGYQAAVLAGLVTDVFTIEIVPTLADRARKTLAGLGYDNVYVRTGDGYVGWPDQAPFDGPIQASLYVGQLSPDGCQFDVLGSILHVFIQDGRRQF